MSRGRGRTRTELDAQLIKSKGVFYGDLIWRLITHAVCYFSNTGKMRSEPAGRQARGKMP